MAAREIKTTLAVDGEQAFKRSLNEAKTSVRNLGTQLTLAQAEFKKDGDAMKLMETRAKALRGEIGAQKEIVKALEGAVKDAAKQYGEGSSQAEKWEAELNRAKATMAGLEAELANNEKGLDRNGKAFDEASDKAGDFSNAVNNMSRGISFEMITSGIGRISSGFETAIKKAGELATSMWNMMRDAAGWADDKVSLAKVYGVDVEELQRMEHAAKVVDTDVDTMIKSRQKLMKAMGQELNSKETQETFQSLRVQVYDNNTGKMREVEDVFWEAGQAIMAMDDEVAQNNAAMKLFGKSWTELKPLFLSGRDAYKKAMEEATVVPAENVEKLASLQDQLDKLDNRFETLKLTVLSDIAPAFETLAGILTDLMEEFNAFLQTDEGKEMMKSLNDALTSFFSNLSNVDLSNVIKTVQGGLKEIKKVFDWISKNGDTLAGIVKGIGAAFGLIKIAGLAANIGKVYTGFKNLWNLKNNPGTPSGDGTNTTTGEPTGGSPTGVNHSPLVTAAGNKLNGLALTANTVAAAAGNIIPALGDKIINETAFGRTLRDGGSLAEAFEAGKQEIIEYGDSVKHNAETFGSDWQAVFDHFLSDTGFGQWLVRLTDSSDGGQRMGFTTGAYDFLMGLNDRSDFEKAVMSSRLMNSTTADANNTWFELQRLWNGEGKDWTDDRVENVLQAVLASGVLSGPNNTTNIPMLTSQDVAEFAKVPDDMVKAVAKGMTGIEVKMDRVTVARLLAPNISQYIAQETQ